MRASRISMKMRCGVLMLRWVAALACLNRKRLNSALTHFFVAGNTAIHHPGRLVTRRDESSGTTRTAASREQECARTKNRHERGLGNCHQRCNFEVEGVFVGRSKVDAGL